MEHNIDFNTHKSGSRMIICIGTNTSIKTEVCRANILIINNDSCKIKGVIVHEEYRGMGIGIQLLKFIIEKFNNQYDIHLNVYANNLPALKLYKKFGFKIVSSDYNNGEKYYSQILKRK